MQSPSLALLLAVCLYAGSCQALFGVSFGSCDKNKTVVTSFNATAYMGTWYEYARTFEWFEIGAKCVSANYTLNSTTDVVTVVNTDTSILNTKNTIEGTAVLDNATSTEAKLTVTFKIPVVGNETAPYWVLATDYTEYAVVYSCVDILEFFKFEGAWILTRSKSPSDSIVSTAKTAVSDAGLKIKSFSKTTQDCDS